MPISEFYRAIRERVGKTLLLMPGVAAVIRDNEGRMRRCCPHSIALCRLPAS